MSVVEMNFLVGYIYVCDDTSLCFICEIYILWLKKDTDIIVLLTSSEETKYERLPDVDQTKL